MDGAQASELFLAKIISLLTDVTFLWTKWVLPKIWRQKQRSSKENLTMNHFNFDFMDSYCGRICGKSVLLILMQQQVYAVYAHSNETNRIATSDNLHQHRWRWTLSNRRMSERFNKYFQLVHVFNNDYWHWNGAPGTRATNNPYRFLLFQMNFFF